MEHKLYSPLPPECYSSAGEEGVRRGIGIELQGAERRPVWNLYWLSDAAVDGFILTGSARHDAGNTNFKLFQACFKAVNGKSGSAAVRDLLLTTTPTAFVAHLHEHGYKHLEPFAILGETWIATMSRRARLSDVMPSALASRGVTGKVGNVFVVGFGQKPSATTIH